jgi:cob(I)alamin adenosyltransferase
MPESPWSDGAIIVDMSSFFTGGGDDGYTGLLGQGRVPKYHIRPEAYGAVDEASAALGLARSSSLSEATRTSIQHIQRDLYRLMAELAATPDQAEQFRTINAQHVAWLEAQIDDLAGRIEMPKAFILPGDSPAGAALDLARVIVRRAERAVARLLHAGEISNAELLRYLNRLSSFCFVLELWENHQAGVAAPTLADEDPG